MIEVSGGLRDRFSGPDAFARVLALDGDLYRAKEGRKTLRFDHDGREYFAKIHLGIGWYEIWKNLGCFHLPVVDASNEWKAVDLLERSGVHTVKVVGKGARGWNPATRQSFILTEALEERVELEDFLKGLGGLKGRARLTLKRTIVRAVADTTRRMHGAGLNHRDFYLNHFHVVERDWSGWCPDEGLKMPLLDLHRAQIRSRIPRRWLAKDLGALLFSAIDCGITDRDLVAFLQVYVGKDWRKRLRDESSMWRAAVKRARGFYKKHRKRKAVLPGVFAHFR